MKRETRKARLEQVAYHEAGHAVVARWLHLKFKMVTIVPGEDSLGHLLHVPTPRSENPELNPWTDRMRLQMERYAMCALAGVAAQRRLRPSSVRSYHGSVDYANVVKRLDCFAGDDKEITLWARLLAHRVRNLIALRWPAVEAVAAALLERKRLTGDEVRDVIDAAYGLQPWRPQTGDK